ncbi:MAG TPA: hypothetical protein PLT00_15800 [Verrucomicrobiota bacterium]|nr:hypothetical protein [Verrucomicrobiota bacterium]HQB18161.1 hypothetical protein [Verrucomicrobiota bacterium]
MTTEQPVKTLQVLEHSLRKATGVGPTTVQKLTSVALEDSPLSQLNTAPQHALTFPVLYLWKRNEVALLIRCKHPQHFCVRPVSHVGRRLAPRQLRRRSDAFFRRMVQNRKPAASSRRKQSHTFGGKAGWKKEIKRLRFDRDIVKRFGLKRARFVTYLECWLNGKVGRDPTVTHYTYDPAWLICEATGLKSATFERIVDELCQAKFIRVKHSRKNMRCYAFSDQKGYFDSRPKEKHVFALREDADTHGEPVAILLYNLRYWSRFNKERTRLFKGRYWRYDTLKELVRRYTGFLTIEQLRDALSYMTKRQLADMIAFIDQNGVPHDDKFWITLLEGPPVDDYEPQNRVRPATMFTPDGTRIEALSERAKQRVLDDKTASPNDKTRRG